MSTNFVSDVQMTKTSMKLSMLLVASMLLSACGSGGESDSDSVRASNVEVTTPEVVEQAPEQVSPVQIFTHPQSLTIEAGQNASFSVAASGGGILSYQWLKNGVAIQGATSNSLSLNAAEQNDAALYSVVVSNSAGSQTSLSALLTVNVQQVVIIDEPVIEEPVVEEPVIEEPVVEEPVIEEPVVEEPVIEEPVVEEPVIEEPVVEEPVISLVTLLTQPQDVVATENTSAMFSVEVSGEGEITYQWLKDGAILDGQNSASLTLDAVTADDAAAYSVIVTNPAGSVFSEVASLTVEAAPVVTSSVALSWDIPQAREDGTALEIYEIEGYVIAFGTDANNLDQQIVVQGGAVQEAVIENLTKGTYFFAIATVDSEGVQGIYSATIEQAI